MLLLLGGVLLATALALLGLALSARGPLLGVDRSVAYLEAMGNAPAEMVADAEPPFAERVLAPLRARALRFGAGSAAPTRRPGPASASTWPATRATGASTPWSPAR